MNIRGEFLHIFIIYIKFEPKTEIFYLLFTIPNSKKIKEKYYVSKVKHGHSTMESKYI